MYIYIRFKKSRDHLKNKVESLPLKPNRTTAYVPNAVIPDLE